MKSIHLYVPLPRSGLCNKILIWANALVWCHKHTAKLWVEGWFHLPLGTWLRREHKNRFYRDFFIPQPIPLKIAVQFKFTAAPRINSIDSKPVDEKQFFQYQGKAYIADLPKLAPYRELLLHSFFQLVHPKIKQQVANSHSPLIGVHIRKGDFVKIGFDVELSYYIEVIESLGAKFKKKPQVYVFSDAQPTELSEVLQLDNVALFPSINDLADVLVLAKSKVLVTSYESSYSYWAAFISDAVVLHHPKAQTQQTRPNSINAMTYEGVFPAENNWPELLLNNLTSLSKSSYT